MTDKQVAQATLRCMQAYQTQMIERGSSVSLRQYLQSSRLGPTPFAAAVTCLADNYAELFHLCTRVSNAPEISYGEDSARMDFLESHDCRIFRVGPYMDGLNIKIQVDNRLSVRGASIRGAVDMARNQHEQACPN